MSTLPACLAVGALLCAAAGSAAAEFQPIAHSAQLTLDGSATPAGLMLRVRPAIAGATLNVTGVSVALDGASESATRQPDGSWLAPLPAARTGGAGKLDVYVLHDGIREVVSGTVSLPAAAGAGGGGPAVLREHKQLAWWILNIAIVLIAAIAISRRMS